MAFDVDAGVSRDVFFPIANALYHAANPAAGELTAAPPAEQERWYEAAFAAFQQTLEQLDPRTRFNVQLAAQVRRLPDEAVLAITQVATKVTLESRRALVVRALRIDGSRG